MPAALAAIVRIQNVAVGEVAFLVLYRTDSGTIGPWERAAVPYR